MRSLAPLALVAVVACGDTSPAVDAGPHDAGHVAVLDAGPAPPAGSWAELGKGVGYRRIGPGAGVFIAYGGYTALDAYSRAWAEQLWLTKLRSLGVGHLYAAKGPQDAGYGAREIANTSLHNHLDGKISDAAPFILIGAHSSGSYVAHELLGELDDEAEDATLKKIVYGCLDGGGDGLDKELVGRLRRVIFVSAKDSSLVNGTSANSGTQQELGQEYAAQGSWKEIVLPKSGCNDGAHWCLHDLLVIHRPHDPAMYDLKNDYTDFAGRPPTTEWIDALAPYLK